MASERLHTLLERTASLHRSELREAAAEYGLKLAQLQALHYLGRCNRYSDTPASLTEFLGATKGTISQTLLALERKGLIEKETDSQDGRVVHCKLTKRGQKVAEKTYPADVVAASDPTQREAVVNALESWLRGLQKSRGNPTFGACATCAHFQTRGRGFFCELTQEPLKKSEITRICREHLALENA